MKLFGIGAVIAPVIGGVALAEDHVKLIAKPKVEIASPPTFEPVTNWAAMNSEVLDVTVFMKDRKSGDVMRMDCQAFVMSSQPTMVDVTSHHSYGGYREFIAPLLPSEITLRCTGELKMARRRA